MAIYVFATAEKADLWKGSVKVAGAADFARQIRLLAMPRFGIINPVEPTRAAGRYNMNPDMKDIVVSLFLSEAAIMAFQRVCNGDCLGKVTITEVDSNGENARVLKTLTVEDAYIVEMTHQYRITTDEASGDGFLCTVRITGNAMGQTRTAVDQAEQAQGQTAVNVSRVKLAAD